MKQFTKDSPLLKLINLANLHSYLISNNWTTQNDIHLNKNITFKSPKNENGEQIEINIPRSESYSDYSSRIYDIVNLLSQINNTTQSNIIKGISSCFTDIFKARILDTGEISSSLPLNEAYKEISGIRQLFLYGAASEVRPARHFEAPLSRGLTLIETCRFGHTFHGSFGFTVEIPIISSNDNQDLFNVPFERKVNERIARGLILLEKSVRDRNPELLIENFSSAFNSKMCDAILNISNQKSKNVEIGFDWAEQILLPSDINKFKSITLTESHFDIISHTSEKLKEVPPEEKTISGYIINLHCPNAPSDDQTKKSILIKYINEYSESIEVRVSLTSHLYRKACVAHINGKVVSLRGTLVKTGNTWDLFNILHSSF